MKKIPVSLLVSLCLLFSLVSSAAISADKSLRVIVSVKPVHSILSGLLKGVEQPELLVGEGKLPLGYELTSAQVDSLETADLIVWVGPELESFMAGHLAALPEKVRVVTLLDRPELKILPSRRDDNRRDPYFWQDSRNALILIDLLTKELMLADSSRSHLYKRNRDALFKKVAELDRRLEYGYRGLKGGLVFTYYDTLQYFEQAYALKVAGVLAAFPGEPVSAEKLLGERARLADNWYTCLLTEARMPMPELGLLTDGLTIEQVELDSFGTGFKPGENLYLELMDNNTRLIKQCVQKKGAIKTETASIADTDEPAGLRTPGGKFMLMDHHGNMITEKDLLGKYQLIYFGYTFCPDVCPSSLSVISTALKRMGDRAKNIQPYFITVDPERDTQEIMANYVAYFHKDMIGLMGSRAMTDRLIKDYNLVVEKVQEEGADPKDYIMDHTASVFLFAPDGKFITKFAHGITATQMVEKLEQYVK
jgi:protein SCO1/2